MKRDKRPSLRKLLRHYGACQPAMRWVRSVARLRGMTTQRMWDECPRGFWIIWIVDTALEGTGLPIHQQADDAFCEVFNRSDEEDANAVRRVITWPVVERALLDRYLRETGGAS